MKDHSDAFQHNFYPYFGSMVITFFGFYGFTYLVTWMVSHHSNNPQILGTILALTMLPAIFLNLIAGRMLQFYSARKIMFVTDLLTGILFISAYFLLQFSSWQMVCLTVVAVLNKAIGVFYKLSNKIILPALFSPDELTIVNGYQTQVRQLAIVSATMLVTLALLWVTPAILILLMGIAFLLSAKLEIQLQPSLPTTDSSVTVQPRPHLPLGAITTAISGGLIDAAIAVTIPWLTVTYLHRGWQLSWLLTAAALGIMSAPLIFKWLPSQSLLTLTRLTSLSLVLMWPTFPVLLGLMYSVGLTRGQFNIQFFTHLQTRTNVNQTMMWTLAILDGTTVIGNLITPFLINWLGQWSLPTLGIGLLTLSLLHNLPCLRQPLAFD